VSVAESWSVFLGIAIGSLFLAYSLSAIAREADRRMERRRREREFKQRWTQDSWSYGPHRRSR
jgi:hypothetical protein